LANNPSTVFCDEYGVIILGSVTGVLLFEKLNTKNYIGLLIALVAIVLITISQLSN
jgi:hypothetical protein